MAYFIPQLVLFKMAKYQPMVRRHPRSTRRYRLFTTPEKKVAQRFGQSRGVELADSGMSDRDTNEHFFVKKRGGRYVGITNRMPIAAKKAVRKKVLNHEYDHLREIAFMDQHGLKRNSRSILAQLSEYFLQKRIVGRHQMTPKSFKEMRQMIATLELSRKSDNDGLQQLTFSFARLFPTPYLQHKIFASLFRSSEMRQHLDYLNSVSTINIPANKVPTIKNALLAIVGFLEKHKAKVL